MPEAKPIVYVLRGDDRQAIEAHLSSFYASMGDANMAEMNTTRLDGKTAGINELQSAGLALPFLAERRLVIVEDALHPFTGRGKQELRKGFLEVLDALPETTAMVLVAADQQKFGYRQGWYWETLNNNHWFIKWANTAGNRVMIIDCALPTEGNMPAWIRKQAQELGGEFTNEAAVMLRDYIGNNTQQALQEITKLLTFVNFARPVEGEDVQFLTVRDHQSDLFELVDAIGNRQGQKAQEKLHILLEEMDFIPLFGMVIRQFRLLIQAREILDLGGSEQDVLKNLGVHAFVAQKIHAQAQQFDLPVLVKVYHRLLEIDLGEKTGGMPGEIALDMLIAQLAW